VPFLTVLGDADHILAVEIIVEKKIGALSHPEEYPFNEGRIVAEGTFGVWRTILKDFGADGETRNSHGFPRRPLKTVCLPVSPHPQLAAERFQHCLCRT
jgi:hypothetical protein